MPARRATSSRRNPGVRRRGPAASPTSGGRSRSRHRRRKSASPRRSTRPSSPTAAGRSQGLPILARAARCARPSNRAGSSSTGSFSRGYAMPKAVRYDRYGGIDVLYVAEVERPAPGPGQVLVEVKAAATNPGEAYVREGRYHDRWPAPFPSGQGSDLAGVVAGVGSGVEGFAVGDEVIGYTDDRASQAEYAVVDQGELTHKPAGVSWEAAGSL